jgi:hypothetical protein
MTTKAVCIKVKCLRKHGYTDLDDWMSRSNNEYVGRRGRIWITNHVTKEKRMFHYAANKWQNPYTLKKYTLRESLILYIDHLFSSKFILDIEELKGKNLGCFCDQTPSTNGQAMCHAQILEGLLGKCYHIIKPMLDKIDTK